MSDRILPSLDNTTRHMPIMPSIYKRSLHALLSKCTLDHLVACLFRPSKCSAVRQEIRDALWCWRQDRELPVYQENCAGEAPLSDLQPHLSDSIDLDSLDSDLGRESSDLATLVIVYYESRLWASHVAVGSLFFRLSCLLDRKLEKAWMFNRQRSGFHVPQFALLSTGDLVLVSERARLGDTIVTTQDPEVLLELRPIELAHSGDTIGSATKESLLQDHHDCIMAELQYWLKERLDVIRSLDDERIDEHTYDEWFDIAQANVSRWKYIDPAEVKSWQLVNISYHDVEMSPIDPIFHEGYPYLELESGVFAIH